MKGPESSRTIKCKMSSVKFETAQDEEGRNTWRAVVIEAKNSFGFEVTKTDCNPVILVISD